jgi:hypothetical protein
MLETSCLRINPINMQARRVTLRGGSGRTMAVAVRPAVRLEAPKVRKALAVSIGPARCPFSWL